MSSRALFHVIPSEAEGSKTPIPLPRLIESPSRGRPPGPTGDAATSTNQTWCQPRVCHPQPTGHPHLFPCHPVSSYCHPRASFYCHPRAKRRISRPSLTAGVFAFRRAGLRSGTHGGRATRLTPPNCHPSNCPNPPCRGWFQTSPGANRAPTTPNRQATHIFYVILEPPLMSSLSEAKDLPPITRPPSSPATPPTSSYRGNNVTPYPIRGRYPRWTGGAATPNNLRHNHTPAHRLQPQKSMPQNI